MVIALIMKTRTIIILSVSLFAFACNSFGQNFDKISREIKKIQLSIQPEAKRYIDCYYNLRAESNSLKNFCPTSKNDTIYMIESLGDWSSLELSSILWNNADTIFCNSGDAGKTYEFVKEGFFTNYVTKLVSEWNIEAINKEEEETVQMQPIYSNFATRIIFKGKKYKIDCIYFQDFI